MYTPRRHTTGRHTVALAAMALAARAALAADPALTLLPQTYLDGFGDEYTAQRISISGFSADGTTVYGTIRANPNGGGDYDRGYTFKLGQDTAATLLQYNPYGYVTQAAGISPDGGAVFGSATLSKTSASTKDAVWWNGPNTATDLGIPSGARAAVANTGDAALDAFAGAATYGSGASAVTRPILWSGGQAQVLNGPTGQPLAGSAVSISADGSTVVVQSASSSTGYYSWTAAGVTEVANPAASQPYAVTTLQITTPHAGVQNLPDFLANHGFQLIGTDAAQGVSGFGGVASAVVGDRLLIAMNDPNQHASAIASLDIPAAPTAWKADANGEFGSASNWTDGAPTSEGTYARLGNVITAPRTVTVNSTWELSHLFLDSTQGYTLAGAGSLLLHSPVTPELRVESGSHTVAVPITFACDIGLNTGNATRDAIINVARAQDTLTVSSITVDDGNAMPGFGYMPLDKTGPGTLVLSPGAVITASNFNIADGTVRAGQVSLPQAAFSLSAGAGGNPRLEVSSLRLGALSLYNGTVKIDPSGAAGPTLSVVGNLQAPDATGFNNDPATMDLSDNVLLLRYASGQYKLGDRYQGHYEDTLTGAAEAGRNKGTSGLWTGYGMTSSLAIASPAVYAVGVASAGQLLNISGAQTGTFMGETVSPNDTIARLTYAGDTDLNGYVDGSDLANLLAGMHGGLSTWANGDLNYDGVVNQADLDLLKASLLNQGAPLGGDGGAGGAVPEPSMLWALAAMPVAMRRRARR